MRFAPEDCSHETLLADFAFDQIHIVADAGEAFEIAFDIGAGLLAADPKLVGEAKSRDPVDDAEIDRFGATTDHRIHPFHRHAEHFRGGHGMDVDAVFKRPPQLWNVGNMGEQA